MVAGLIAISLADAINFAMAYDEYASLVAYQYVVAASVGLGKDISAGFSLFMIVATSLSLASLITRSTLCRPPCDIRAY